MNFQTKFPELNENQRRMLYRELLEIIPHTIDTSKYRYEDSAQDFMLGYVQHDIEVKEKLDEYFGEKS